MRGIRLTVKNLIGPAGIPDALHLFEKYHRSEQAKRKSGTGLGLYLARGIAEKLGFVLVFEPDDDEVIFSLWMPISPP